MLFLFSRWEGGDVERNISPNLVEALKFSKTVGAKIVGIVGRDGEYTAQVADACVDHPDSESRHGYATLRSLSSGSMASARVSSQLKAQQTKWEALAS